MDACVCIPELFCAKVFWCSKTSVKTSLKNQCRRFRFTKRCVRRPIDRESGFYEFFTIFFLKFVNFTELQKCPLNFFKFSTLILTEKLQSHFFTVTETLNSEQSDSNQCFSESESATVPFNSCFNVVHNLNFLQFNHKTYQ